MNSRQNWVGLQFNPLLKYNSQLFRVLLVQALLVLLLQSFSPVRAVEQITTDGNGSYSGYFDAEHYVDPALQTDPAFQVPNWNSGWGNTSGLTGWNLVGKVNTSNDFGSGVYLGNGWVITAQHVGADLSNFVLNGTSYGIQNNTYQVLNYTGNAPDALPGTKSDLALFRLTSSPQLPQVTLSLNLPQDFSDTTMVGFGNPGPNSVESWGAGYVAQGLTNEEFHDSATVISTDYGILTGVIGETGNLANIYPGDSGGADFVYNSVTKQWELAGIMEFVAPSAAYPTLSGFVQVNAYTDQIDNIIAAPEPATWVLVGVGISFLMLGRRRFTAK